MQTKYNFLATFTAVLDIKHPSGRSEERSVDFKVKRDGDESVPNTEDLQAMKNQFFNSQLPLGLLDFLYDNYRDENGIEMKVVTKVGKVDMLVKLLDAENNPILFSEENISFPNEKSYEDWNHDSKPAVKVIRSMPYDKYLQSMNGQYRVGLATN